MKKLLAVTFMLWSAVVLASQSAVTDTGEMVILKDDGTWEYANKRQDTSAKISVNNRQFKKPAESQFQLKSTKNNSVIWLNQKAWSFEKSTGDAASEYEFTLRGQDLYAMLITEQVPIPVETLANLAMQNARQAAPDAHVVNKEYRYVNGNKILFMQFDGTIQGIQFSYFGYYYSDKSGSTQFLTYTSSNLAGKYKKDIFDFLNGYDLK